LEKPLNTNDFRSYPHGAMGPCSCFSFRAARVNTAVMSGNSEKFMSYSTTLVAATANAGQPALKAVLRAANPSLGNQSRSIPRTLPTTLDVLRRLNRNSYSRPVQTFLFAQRAGRGGAYIFCGFFNLPFAFFHKTPSKAPGELLARTPRQICWYPLSPISIARSQKAGNPSIRGRPFVTINYRFG